jgi:hypothetical protein
MKTIAQLVSEAHNGPKAEYLQYTLVGQQEILAFAQALRNQVLDEAIATVGATWTNNKDFIVANLASLKVPRT